MTVLEGLYYQALQEQTDIVEHLPVLRKYASRCDHVTEFGVRRGMSTRSLAAGHPKILRSYDLTPLPEGQRVIEAAKEDGIDAVLVCEDTTTCDYEPTDLLLLDTLHTRKQVASELAVADERVRHWLMFHDTISCGDKGEDGGEGILPAIEDFRKQHPRWIVEADLQNCNGLLILRRQ